jgi:hypothetical protein
MDFSILQEKINIWQHFVFLSPNIVYLFTHTVISPGPRLAQA